MGTAHKPASSQPRTPGPAVQRMLDYNIHLSGRCREYIRLALLTARATDRLERRSNKNDTIQDIRLQRQARSLANDLLALAYRHNDHDYTTHV
jgi:hypothetical protein